MFEVTTIRSLPPGPDGSGPRVEVTTGRPGVLARIIGAVVFVVLAAVLVVLALIAVPLLVIGLGVVLVVGSVWVLWMWFKVRRMRQSIARESGPVDEGRENVRVRRDGGAGE